MLNSGEIKNMKQIFPSSFKKTDNKKFMTLLNQRVKDMIPNNPTIIPLNYTEEFIEDKGINFNVKILHLFGNKPEANKDTFKKTNIEDKKKEDPFMPPFEEGRFIDNLSDTHSLIHNRYSVS